ncbi:MAG: amidohydrolase family protein [Trueperaceae bacterium]|nr:amidohydrolase family protein [Trueperaceae bacterium]MCC6312102.1 amidohydrolase family protein [Trueperaceae bacterium]MCO5174685.1 amidohydrolase family protein [Trueperaceae bacterium]MCW5819416.1 amidohydrolase family protein [Trueperaceae bacterium]
MTDGAVPRPGAGFVVRGGTLVLPDGLAPGAALVVVDGTIAAVVPESELTADQLAAPTLDAGGAYVLPGLVDIHTHGASGRLFNEADDEAWSSILATQLAHGVTSVLPTTLTASIPELTAALAQGRRWLRSPAARSARDGTPRDRTPYEPDPGDGAPAHAQVLGMHVEGPYFALAQSGAQDPAHIRNPDDGTVDELLAYADAIRLMSFAPELPGALELTSRLSALGIVPAAGHSSARDEHLAAAMARGLTHVIHLFSAQSTTVREGPWRKPGLLEASLAFDGLTVEVIADHRHLPTTLLRLAYKAIGPDRLCIVSDATHGAGMPEGTELKLGGLDIVVGPGVAMLKDLTAFAGSTTLLDRMLQVMHFEVGLPLAEVVRMASLNPARAVGAAGRKGSLEPGKDADFALFSPALEPLAAYIGGARAVPKSVSVTGADG